VGDGPREVEIKLVIPSAVAGRSSLERSGFVEVTPRTFESNIVLDRPDLSLRGAGCLLRLRDYGGASVLTFKGPALAGKHKDREEIETALADFNATLLLLARLGFQPVFRYEKFRTEFRKPGVSGAAVLDETPIGDFLEIEGDPVFIDRTAADLGFGPADYRLESYGTLYRDYCLKQGRNPMNMTFEESK
jgi:adenylate cyclase, class 2